LMPPKLAAVFTPLKRLLRVLVSFRARVRDCCRLG
jgi:hypothetical protein